MTVNRWRLYLGPLGSLFTLPGMVKDGNPTANPTLVGNMFVGINAVGTLDRQAVKKQWQLKWDYMQETDWARLFALYTGMQTAAVYLVDPRHTNLLTPRMSSCGATYRSTKGFTVSGGSMTFKVMTAPLLPAALVGLVDGGIEWYPTASGQTWLSGVAAVPVIPGSTYSISGYVGGSGGTAQLLVNAYGPTGTLLGTGYGTTITPTGTAQQAVLANWAPPTGTASLQFGLVSGGAGTIDTTGWQVQVDQSVTPWVPGEGSSRVLLPALTCAYPRLGYYGVQLNLQEV